MMPAITVIQEKNCTGCFGCYNACPKNAVDLALNRDGFYIPNIDYKKCTECGICQKFCPVMQNKNINKVIGTYACFTNNRELLSQSSSGGVFGELAKEFINSGGVVFGAGWDEELKLVHKNITSLEELSKIQGSKYIQSNINMNYIEAIKLAKIGKNILFCGTPCQIASFNNFILKEKEEIKNKILMVDLICHGVCSTKVFEKYLDYLKKKYNSEIKSINFRSKKNGWLDYGMEILFENNKIYFKSHKLDLFMRGFLENIYLRESCYECKFSKIPRYGDITLGDLWGPKEHIYNHLGVSIVLINSKKGDNYFNKLIMQNKVYYKKYPLLSIEKTNPRINGAGFIIHKDREKFFNDIEDNDFVNLSRKYLKKGNINVYLRYTIFKGNLFIRNHIWLED